MQDNGVRTRAIKLAEATPHPENYNEHDTAQLARLRGSLAAFGYVRRIVVQEHADGSGYTLVAGHGVAEALEASGYEEVEATVLPSDWSHEKVLAYLVADNELAKLAQSDNEQLARLLKHLEENAPELVEATGYDDDRLNELLESIGFGVGSNGQGDAEPQIDRAEELRQQWGTELGQLWQIGEHRLIVGDCTDRAVVERVMGGERAGMVFTDPPFATFASSTGKLEITDFGMIRPFYEKLLDATLPHVEFGRGLFICCDWRSYPMLFGLGGIDPKNLIVWVHGALRMGSHFRPQHEFILYATNTAFDKRFSKKNKTYEGWKIADRGVGDVWHIKQAEASPGGSRIHASQKPVELPAFAMTHASLENEIIGDWFAGSGTVMVACQNLNRRCRAIEISPAYCGVILQRFYDAFGIRGVLIE